MNNSASQKQLNSSSSQSQMNKVMIHRGSNNQSKDNKPINRAQAALAVKKARQRVVSNYMNRDLSQKNFVKNNKDKMQNY